MSIQRSARQPTPTSRLAPVQHQRLRRTLLVFSADLLPTSQTFVRDHVRSIQAFDTLLLGTRRVDGIDLGDIETYVLPPSRFSRMLLFLFGVSPFLDALVREYRVVAIHAHFAQGGMRMARYARRRGLPLIVTLHGSDVLKPRREGPARRMLTAILERELKRSATLFLAVADHLRRAAIGRGYPEQRIRRHFLGIPLPSEAKVERRASSKGPPAILFVGRLVETKGLTHLIDACRILERRGCQFRLVIIGDGPLTPRHRHEAATLRSSVEFLGAVPSSEVARQMQAADIFCVPSLQEGLGIAYLEAQAAGLPVVAFDLESLRETIQSDVTGLLAAVLSIEQLADALERLLNNSRLRAGMGDAGAKFVREVFDIRERSRELEDIYRLVVDGGS